MRRSGCKRTEYVPSPCAMTSSTRAGTLVGVDMGLMRAQEGFELFDHVVEVRGANAGVDTDKKCAFGDDVGVGEVTDDAAVNVLIRGVAQEVTAKEVAGFDEVIFEELGELIPSEASVFANGDGEAEPRRVTVGRSVRKDEPILVGAQARVEGSEVFLAAGDEVREFVKLSAADGGLHVGDFEIVANVGIDIFVVVAEREGAELL